MPTRLTIFMETDRHLVRDALLYAPNLVKTGRTGTQSD